MLGEINYSLPDLFAQLGLPSDSDAIDIFIANNQLFEGENLRRLIYGILIKGSFYKKPKTRTLTGLMLLTN